jgi:hypothetical protein
MQELKNTRGEIIMALLERFKREASQLIKLLQQLGLGDQNVMAANYRHYAMEWNIRSYDDFMAFAGRFYKEALANPNGFTFVRLPDQQMAIDFQGKIRGVYTKSGEPVALFRPDYQQLGYQTLQEELHEFRSAVFAVA